MATSALGDLARVLVLDACGSVLDAFCKLPPAAPLDEALSQPPATDALTATAHLVRRGFDSSLVAVLRSAFAADVIARGLLAWDVLNGSIVERGEYRDQLHADARVVAAVLPAPGGAFVRIDKSRGAPLPGGGSGPRIEQVMRALGGSQVDPADTSPGALDRARNFARMLHRSHLSTMASFYLADLVFQHRHARALPDLVEVLLDRFADDVEGLVLAVGEIDPGVEPSITELATYAHVRTLINAGHAGESLELAEISRATFSSVKLTGDKAAAINPRPTLAYADAALRKGKPTIVGEHIEALTRLELPWRYAFYVATFHAATTTASLDFLVKLATYIQSFGNDYQTWYQVARAMPKGAEWGHGFLSILVRELEQLPHDVQAWRSAAMLLGKDEATKRAIDECDDRLHQQATLPA
jgi:hypothetical protein